MRIRPSLRIYFIAMMLVTGITTISIMSVVSLNAFFEGIDFSMADSMRFQAYKHEVKDGKPIKVDNFSIATQWQDLPAEIQANLSKKDLQDNTLIKHIEGTPLLSKPKAGYFAMKIDRNGEVRYISSMFTPTQNDTQPLHNPPQYMHLIVIGLIAIIAFSLLPYIILRKVTRPVERLMQWANKLDKENLSQPIPDFHYSELNHLATMMKASLQSVQETLIREQRFLGYASHELRTPIAVARSNSELLRKMIAKNISVDKQEDVIDRIDRACLTMTDLTETLLWLNRKADKPIPIKPVALGALTQQLIEELTYLHKGKVVVIFKEADQSNYPQPAALCRIVMTNLLRNAFQHTQQGVVTVKQSKTSIIIINENMQQETQQDKQNSDKAGPRELGFGLGLELTERLVKQYGWYYRNIATTTGHHVEINFNKPDL